SILLFVLRRFIGPLFILVRGIRELSAGRLSHRVSINRDDEVGEMASAFNEMAQSLESSRQQLEESNKTLEEKVRQRTQALEDSEARYRAFFESTGTAMVIIDDNGTISLVNAEFEKMFGYSRGEIQGEIPWISLISGEDLNSIKEFEASGSSMNQSSPKHCEIRVSTKDNRLKYIFMTISPIPGTAKKIGSIIDISDRKRLENELLQAQKLEAIGTLAGGIAHDFNNLLMGIQGYASLMLFNLEANHPHFEQLRKIEEYVQSGANLTRQLLGFARGGKYEIKPTDLNDIIEKTSSLFGRTKKEIRIEKKYETAIWSADVDRGQIEQVLLNLYVNAWQAMPGGGNLLLETANLQLSSQNAETFDAKPGRYVRISITDTGVGMDDKTKIRIFEPFFTTKEMGRGTGLGLATVYGIVKGHNGIINVYSEKGHGTSFHIYLPASDKNIVKENSVTETLVRGDETILLVDDEEGILDVSREILTQLGYRVITARGGREAVEIYREEGKKIDLVILDMIMPQLSGGETFDLLQEINSGIKVILSSGYSLNSMASQIMERGCRSFIQKPFSVSAIAQRIREVLDHRGA
ncbi:MAG: PAS domain S-box protein, partial [Syntrophales bacterium]|nr:PAS domain S-box protein [Syntrophales bacterium]